METIQWKIHLGCEFCCKCMENPVFSMYFSGSFKFTGTHSEFERCGKIRGWQSAFFVSFNHVISVANVKNPICFLWFWVRVSDVLFLMIFASTIVFQQAASLFRPVYSGASHRYRVQRRSWNNLHRIHVCFGYWIMLGVISLNSRQHMWSCFSNLPQKAL